MAAVIFTGIVLGQVGTVFLWMFLLACVVCAALVELRGLFLTVAMIPLYWFIGVGLVGFFADTKAFTGAGRRTAFLTVAFPAIEHYRWLVVSFIVSLVIAVVRVRLDTAARARAQRLEGQRRRRIAESDEDNRRVTSRVRELERTGGRRRADDRPTTTQAPTESRRVPRTVNRPRRSTAERSDEVRTRTAAELRAASERRRSRDDGSRAARHRDPDSPLNEG